MISRDYIYLVMACLLAMYAIGTCVLSDKEDQMRGLESMLDSALSLLAISTQLQRNLSLAVTPAPAATRAMDTPPGPAWKDTAVCVSGQLRTLNMPPSDPSFPQSFQPMTTAFTAADMQGRTVAETIQAHLYPALGEFDVYMTVITAEGPREPRVGDLTACDSLTPPPPARLFCEVIRQEELAPIHQEIWNTFYYPNQHTPQQGVLNQLYNQQRCSMMMSRQIIQENIQYRYAVRLRPDMAILKPVPPIGGLLSPDEPSVVKFIDPGPCCCGNEDTFGIGHYQAMALYFNRIISVHEVSKRPLMRGTWTSESMLMEYLKDNFGISLVPDSRIVGCLVKPTYRSQVSDP